MIESSAFPFVTSPECLREQIYQEQLLEWIALVLIDSPRVHTRHQVDPYLCRYQLPEAFVRQDSSTESNLVHIRWYGLIPPRFLREALSVLEEKVESEWFVMGSKGFEGRTVFAITKGSDVISWDLA